MAGAHPASVQPPQAPAAPPPGAPSPYGAPPYWAPPRQRPLGPIVAVVVFLVVFLVIALVMIGTFVGFGGGSIEMFFPFCGVVFVLVIMAILIAVYGSQGGFRRANLPPPPPIQQPMVPAGMQGPVSLECPNCGAPPVNVDRFGVATCTYCGTRFLVR